MKNIFVICLIVLFSRLVYGWDAHGHFLISQIAYSQLSNETLSKVQNDLIGFKEFFPKYSDPLSCSIWPDAIRSFGIETFTSWHYIDIPYTPNYTKINEPSDINIRWALKEIYKSLQNPKSNNWTKNFMLRFLIHLVGDLHQPFHNVEYYSSQYPNGDMGGNLFRIWYNWRYTNLHKFWDSAGYQFTNRFDLPLSDNDQEFIRKQAQDLMSNHDKIDVDRIDFDEWSNESNWIAVSFAYPGAENSRNLSEDYVNKTRLISREQILKAGYRLGYILNELYGDEKYGPFKYCYSKLELIMD